MKNLDYHHEAVEYHHQAKEFLKLGELQTAETIYSYALAFYKKDKNHLMYNRCSQEMVKRLSIEPTKLEELIKKGEEKIDASLKNSELILQNLKNSSN